MLRAFVLCSSYFTLPLRYRKQLAIKNKIFTGWLIVVAIASVTMFLYQNEFLYSLLELQVSIDALSESVEAATCCVLADPPT
jgi:hypothetical protein